MPDLIRKYAPNKHILGVCLGHQCIAEVFGGQLYNLSVVLHGVSTSVNVLDDIDDPLFKGVPKSFKIGRYHSWAVKPGSLNDELELLAVDDDGEVMAMKHRDHCVYGVQFHPESVITDNGKQMLKNWLELPVERNKQFSTPVSISSNGHGPSTPKADSMKAILNHLLTTKP